jgi:transposase
MPDPGLASLADARVLYLTTVGRRSGQPQMTERSARHLILSRPTCSRMCTRPPLTATALMAAVSAATHWKHGRQFVAGVGRVPGQHATGGRPRLLGMSQRGDVYLRTLLVHGARATLRWVGLTTDRCSQWVRALIEGCGQNKALVELFHPAPSAVF